MKKMIVIAAALLAIAGPTFAQNAPQKSTFDGSKLTVREVIGVLNGLKALDNAPTGKTDPNGNQITAATNFVFSGTTLQTFALNANRAQQVMTSYQVATNALIKRLSNGGATLGDIPAEKRGEYLEQDAKMGDAPAGVTLSKINVDDLCLEIKKPTCEQKNAIPVSVLGALVPILDGLK